MTLLDRRCFHHDGREAVAQCPSCKLFFCRECVTEHAGRMICVTCVHALTRDATKTARAVQARWTITALAGILIAWAVFYYLGVTLARIPSKFHGASVFQNPHNIAKTGTDHSVPRRHQLPGSISARCRVDRAVCPGFRPDAKGAIT